jgi:hypothetical protein
VLNLRVRTLGENELIEVETPQATAAILRPGSYRLEVNPDGSATVVKVSSGMLEARGSADQSFVVRAQQVATLTGKGRLTFATATLAGPDAFDQWALERDRRDDYVLSTEPARNMPADIVGYEDLDKYGTWQNEPNYGYVWSPTYVSAGWSPYRFGRYTYVSGWGWAWIDDAPWGFAPYHYGQWVSIGSRWCWVPGPRHGRPVGRPIGGTPIVGRPSGGSRDHGWHVPRPPRGGVTVENHAGRYGTLVGSGAPTSTLRPSVDDRRSFDDRRVRSPRYETPRNENPRYEVPRNPRMDSRVGGAYTPPASSSPQRSEEPRRGGGRFSTGSSIPSQPRPATPPPQQQRPVMSQPRPAPSPPANADRGNGANGAQPRAATRER